MMEFVEACAFTGHREIQEEIDKDKLKGLIEQLADEGTKVFLCGMARGFDLLAAEQVLSVKKTKKDVKLIACVPCGGQEKYYPEEDKKRYEEIINKCDEKKVLSEHYYNGCMIVRDKYMVDHCSSLIAYVRRDKGGAHYTVKYAAENKKRIYLI